MPSVIHEALVELFRVRPQLAAELLAAVHAIGPDEPVSGALLDADLSQVVAPEYRADALVHLSALAWQLVLVIEVQLRIDARKRKVWPVYASVAHARHEQPAAVLVITLDRSTAAWAAEPIVFGPGATLIPIVIGPEQVPMVTDPEVAKLSPEIAVLSAMAHGESSAAAQIGIAAAEAARDLDEERSRLYLDLVLRFLNPAARIVLEKIMIQNWQPQSEFFQRLDAEARAAGRAAGHAAGHAEGDLDGQRKLLTRLLHRRFGALPPEIQTRLEQADEAQLGQWGEELMFADSLSALFGAR